MTNPLRSQTLALILTTLCALTILTTTALAQQDFTLSDEDTWEPGEAAEPGTPAFQIAEARRALANNELDRAENLASQFIERNPRSSLLGQAYLIRADALMKRKDYYKALFDYEFIARMYPGSEVFVTALQREYEIAVLFATGTKRKLWGFAIVNAEKEAEELLIRIQERLPGSRLAEQAGMELADYYFRKREMKLAADAYDLFLANYPRSPQVSKARRRLVAAYLAAFKGPEFDATGLYEARSKLVDIKAQEPAIAQELGADALLAGIDDTDARKILTTAQWYLRTNDPIAAERLIRRLVKRYPTSVAAADALRLIPQILPRLSTHILAETPDYDALRAAILGIGTQPTDLPPTTEPEFTPTPAEDERDPLNPSEPTGEPQ